MSRTKTPAEQAERDAEIAKTVCGEVWVECLSATCAEHAGKPSKKPARKEPPYATGPTARGRKLIATLGTFDRNATNRLHVSLQEFRGARYVDARLEYRLRDDEPWTPTSKGVTLKRAETEALAVALLRALDEWPVTPKDDR